MYANTPNSCYIESQGGPYGRKFPDDRGSGGGSGEWYGSQGVSGRAPWPGGQGGEKYGANIARNCENQVFCYFNLNNFFIIENNLRRDGP